MGVEIDVAENLGHALELLGAADPNVRPVAGATDVVLRLHAKRLKATKLVSIAGLSELEYVRPEANAIRFGAGTTLTALLEHPEFCREFPCAAESLRQFASPQIRNRATLGGNIGNASPAADMVPPMIALEAQVSLRSKARGVRTVPLEELFLGFGKTTIAADELVTELVVPRRADCFQAFAKFGSRGANVIAVVNMAMCLKLNGAHVERARIAYGSVAPKTLRATAVESFLEGRELNGETLKGVSSAVLSAIAPIDDVRGSAAYRVEAALTLVRRGLATLGGAMRGRIGGKPE
jgi:carbon-monoxide dehydrogenase medium subunit